MGLFGNLFSKKQEPQQQPIQQPEQKKKGIIKSQRHKVENIKAHMEDIMELVDKNEDFRLKKKDFIEDNRTDEKVYEYELNAKAEITTISCGGGVEELQVFVHDTHIGNIKKGSISKVKKLLNSGTIQRIDAEVSGGKYKLLSYRNSEYYFDELESEFSITIEITYREEIAE